MNKYIPSEIGRDHKPTCPYHFGSGDQLSNDKRWVIEPKKVRPHDAPWTVERTADQLKCTSFWCRKEHRGWIAVPTVVLNFLIVFLFPWTPDPDGTSIAERAGSFEATLPFTLPIAAALTYFMLTVMFNRTELHIAGGRLTVRRLPLPSLPSVSLPTEEITQILCREIHDKRGSTYALYAVMNDQVMQKLFGGLSAEAPEVARQLESAIMSFLGLAQFKVDKVLPEARGFTFKVRILSLIILLAGVAGLLGGASGILTDMSLLGFQISAVLWILGFIGLLSTNSLKSFESQ